MNDKESHIIYRLTNIARVIKYNRLKWAGRVVRMEGYRNAFKIVKDNPTGRKLYGFDEDGKIISEYNLRIRSKNEELG